MLFPPHKDVVSLCEVSDGDGPLASHLLVRPESAEFGPVTQVDLGVGPPVIVLGEEVVLGADDFSLKVGSEGWVVLSQSCRRGSSWLARCCL